MAVSTVKKLRASLATALVAALSLSLGVIGISPASAAGPPVTLTLTAVDPGTNAALTQVESGKDFIYLASIGCPDPDGCGPATYEVTLPDLVQFVEGGFNPPTGTEYTFTPASTEPGAPGGTLTIKWDPLGGTAVAYIPVRVSETVDTSNNGRDLVATSALTAGSAEPLERNSTVNLRVYERPDLTGESMVWTETSLNDGTHGTASTKLTGTAGANSSSSLTFRVPGSESVPAASLPVAEAFDLGLVSLSANPAGAVVTFFLADGTSGAPQTLAPGSTEATAPVDAVGYEVVVNGLPSLESSEAAARTITVQADYTLRDTKRSGGPIIDPSFNQREVRATADVTNTVTDPAPATSPTVSKPVRANIQVRASMPEIQNSITWLTASGDATSVYESGEASTATVKVWNAGESVLRDLTITVPALNATYFNYQRLTAVPTVKFPAGAATATIQYHYKAPLGAGSVHTFAAGDDVPGPDADGDEFSLDQLTGITVSFAAPEGGGIDGQCDSADHCAAQLLLDSELRDTHLITGKPITPPAQEPTTTPVTLLATASATAANGSSLSQETQAATVQLVKPQFKAALSKRIGDGTDDTVYPLTGIAKAGDYYDPALPPEQERPFRDHPMTFVAKTSAIEEATETPGARELTISDPQTAPTVANLKSNPFNAVGFSAIATGDAVCTSPDGDPIASQTTQQVWVVDSVTAPTTVTKVALDGSIDPSLIVGIEISITPAGGETRFPLDVSCSSASGTTLKFRHQTLSDGTIVSPENLQQEATPGLFTMLNTAGLVTGKNTSTATGGDAMFLIDLLRASVYKHFAKGAKGFGVQGEESPTAFLVAGVPGTEHSVATRVTDGILGAGGAVTGEAFDIFKLAGVRDAHVGPDQKMTVSLFGKNGQPVGPTGTVAAGSELAAAGGSPARQLTEEEIEDSQSAGYLEYQRTDREIDWSAELTPEIMANVASVQFEVTRSDEAKALQRFGGFSLTLDATLRTTKASDQAARITGEPSGTVYYNTARIESLEPGSPATWSKPIDSSLKYRVFAATDLFVNATAQWSDANTTSDRYLVAKHQTPSRVQLTAENRTAVGVVGDPAPAPEDQWKFPGAVAVGLESLAAGVGGAADAGRNPFAITNFAGVQNMTWPMSNGGEKPADRVTGKITYTFSEGDPEIVDAPVGAALTSLNPDPAKWDQVVGVSITWSEPGKYVGITRPNQTNTGTFTFRTDLRDDVREGYSYSFVAGDPLTLGSNESIDGPQQTSEPVVDQYATLDANYAGTLEGFDPATGATESNRVQIDVASQSVGANAQVSSGALYRDTGTNPLQQKTDWTLTGTNTSNIPVSGLWLATDKALLDASTWPQQTPESYEVGAGSAFDVFNVTAARLIFPKGAARAQVFLLGEDRTWSDAIVVPSNSTAVTLPTTGSGPKTWAEVTGLRVQFEAAEGTPPNRVRIDKGSAGSLVLSTHLRDTRRTDPSQIAPSTVVPAPSSPGAQQSWLPEMTVQATVFVGKAGTTFTPTATSETKRTVLPGAPQPFTGKYTLNYDPEKPFPPTSTVGNPGTWVNFYLVLRNSTNATSNLYTPTVIDTLPAGLRYSAVNAASEWSVLKSPSRFGAPTFSLDTGESGTSLRWQWAADDYLKPGEYVVVRVPLQVTDGLAAGASVRNTARTVGTGIDGLIAKTLCDSETSSDRACTAEAYVTSLRQDSVRAESYIDATVGGASTLTGDECDSSTAADWADGKWVKHPCIVDTTADGTLKYRLKLINSGNIDIGELRFVDELPKVGDKGAVLDSPRNSEWTPQLVPGSVKLLTGDAATALGAHSTGTLSAPGVRYSPSAKPCALNPDAFSGPDTLLCTDSGAQWSATPSAESQAFGADITFPADAKLAGGGFVIVEFEMKVPSTDNAVKVSWNTAAVTGRATQVAGWLPASESPRSGARAQDTSLQLTLDLEDADVTDWHLLADEFTVMLACVSPGQTDPTLTTVSFPRFPDGTLSQEKTVTGLPRGGSCQVVDERYVPSTPTDAGQYGTVSDGVSGYSFTTDPEAALVLDGNAAKNSLAVTNVFAVAQLNLGVTVEGSASGKIPADAEFEVGLTCAFGGVVKEFTPFKLKAGETIPVPNLPVGATCKATETDHLGATRVSATVGGVDTPLDSSRGLTLTSLNPGEHTAIFVNTFEEGGALNILKRVELPKAGLEVGDVEFAVSCELGGVTLDLGDSATLRHTFPPGETEAFLPVPGVPVGASCTVSETVTGGADVPAPDRTVTILADDEVTVEMVNRYEPAELVLSKTLTGPGASERRVPDTFGIDATCTRELEVGGELRTVTDFSGTTRVTPGSPVSLTGLPNGSQCSVTEPDRGGAEHTEFRALTAAAPDEDPSEDSALVTLVGPSESGEVTPTAVEVTNRFAATEDLGGTGGAGLLAAGGAGLLLVALGAFALTRRRASHTK